MSPNLLANIFMTSGSPAMPQTATPQARRTKSPTPLYADDLSISSHSQEGPQHLVNALQAFYHRKRMVVNIHSDNKSLANKGQRNEQVHEIWYLGFDRSKHSFRQ
jgi:hypothetical protein